MGIELAEMLDSITAHWKHLSGNESTSAKQSAASPQMEGSRSDDATISTQSLTKRFGRTLAVDDISLTVPEGSIYALVGANGAGTTTLIKLS